VIAFSESGSGGLGEYRDPNITNKRSANGFGETSTELARVQGIEYGGEKKQFRPPFEWKKGC